MSLSDINPQIDPGADTQPSQPLNESTTSMKDTVINSEVGLGNLFRSIITDTNSILDLTLFPVLRLPLDASAAANAVRDHPITQNVTNGPVAQSVKAEAAQTSNELGGLANSRQVPSHTTATGQKLTNYHSFFYTLLSWEHPRATGLTFFASVAFIFACRYLPVLKWFLKVTWMTLGVVTLAEVGSKYATGGSVTSSVRPRKYYVIPKETLEASLDDLEQLINFFVIEVQRIIFAENIPATALAFTSAFVSYYLIKILPFWGLSLVFTSVLYLAPLIYVQNKELIDSQLRNASNIIGEQTAQVKDLTAQQTNKGIESLKAYTSDYTAKASELVESARQKIPTSTATNPEKTTYNEADFPTAPQGSLPSAAEHTKPIVHAPSEGEPVAASST